MSALDTSEFKTRLEQERERLLHASGRLRREGSTDIEEESGESGGADNHMADMASATYDRELDDGLEEGLEDTLRQVDAALQRIEDGTYGICEICGKPIGEERLRAIPWTTRCIDDQRRG